MEHINEKPWTFVLLFVAGCSSRRCAVVEKTMKRIIEKEQGFELVGNSKEEFLVPPGRMLEVAAEIEAGITREHRDLLTLASDVPVDMNIELEKLKIDADTEVRKRRDELRFKLAGDFLQGGQAFDPTAFELAMRVLGEDSA
jgi:hypothetical protein